MGTQKPKREADLGTQGTADGGYTLYGSFLSAPTYKAGLMLTLSGLNFAYRHVDLSKGEHKEPAYLAISRWGQVPALVHGSRRLVQSNVILHYLAETTHKFRGRSEDARWQALEWLAWEADRLLPGMGRSRFFVRFMKPEPPIADYFRKSAEAGLKTLDSHLAKTPFLTGADPTIADIGCFGTVVHAAEANIDLAEWPNVDAWCGRIRALPGFKPPYELLPKGDAEAA